MSAIAPIHEAERQHTLDRYHVLDTPAEAAFDDIVQLASLLCGTPIALISLIDRDRQWFKARQGFDGTQTRRDISICDHAIRTPEHLFEVPDLSQDTRFASSPLVDGRDGAARFYAGAPLVAPDGQAIGTVCVLDDSPRQLNETQRESLQLLARIAIRLLESRRRERTLEQEAIVASAAPAAAATPEAAYTVALIELQDHAGLIARLGERATEKLLEELDAALERTLTDGDTVSRSSGGVEYVAVVQAPRAATALPKIKATLAGFEQRHALAFLVGTAQGTANESTTALLLRADADLLSHKPPPAFLNT